MHESNYDGNRIDKTDSYKNIQGYAKKYAGAVENKGGISTDEAKKEVFAVLMEKWDVSRLLMHPKCYKLAAIIGIADHTGSDRITISLLAVGEDGNILPEHTGKGLKDGDPTLPGEEVWPTVKTIEELNTFLP